MTNSYRPQVYNPNNGQFARQPSGSFTEVEGMVQPALAQSPTANDPINPIGGIVAISSASAITLTSTPAIARSALMRPF